MQAPVAVAQSVLRSLNWLPEWLLVPLVFAAAFGSAWLVHRQSFRLLRRLVRERSLFQRSLVPRTEGPGLLAVVAIALSFASRVAPLTTGQADVIGQVLVICLIALAAWMLQTA